MNVLVAGSHGKTGMQIVILLLENDHHVTAMVKEQDQLQEMEKLGAKPLLANLEADVEFATEGIEAVIFAAGSGPHTGPDKTITVDQEGAIKLIEACEKNAVERFVMLSAMGVENPEEGPEKIRHYLKAKHKADERLKKSNLNYTIIRPGRLTNEEETGTIEASEHLTDHGEISRANVALTIVESLDNESTYRKTIDIVNGDKKIIEALNEV
ncbi:MAG: SDR family oxidoreductase [Cyclobacteriaceae bacterium]